MTADFVHEGHARIVLGFRHIGQGVNEFAGLVVPIRCDHQRGVDVGGGPQPDLARGICR